MVSVHVLCDPRFDPDLTYTISGEIAPSAPSACSGRCETCEAMHRDRGTVPPCMDFTDEVRR